MACLKKYTRGSFYTCSRLDKVYSDCPVVVSLTATGGKAHAEPDDSGDNRCPRSRDTRESSGQQTAGNIPAGVSDQVSIGVSRDW